VDPAGLGILGASAASPRPDLEGDPNSGAPQTLQEWFNTSAFANVPSGELRPGTEGRGVVRGPGYARWDISLFKNFRITEAVGPQFRAEMFNVFNHLNPDTVQTSFTLSSFGQITGYRDPRIVQFALKFRFKADRI
jgi:hypothetical protein